MSRIRTIKPEFWTDEQVVECSPTARLLFIGLWNFCDDQGIHPYSPKTIKMEIFPGDDFKITTIENLLQELIKNSLVKTYHVDNKQYLIITGWRHQKIEKPNSKYPIPQLFDDQSENAQQPVGDQTPEEGIIGRDNRKGRDKRKTKTSIPENFGISERVKKWAADKKHNCLEDHLESFKLKCRAKDYQYVDWDEAFMNAIRDNWAKIGNGNGNGQAQASDPPPLIVSCPVCGGRVTRSDLTETGCVNCRAGIAP
ncbi:MAG: hypothetical protein ABFD76_08785 [Smithella sp.]|jgi:hypothetical protein